ncbi:MAG: class I adenylate-forming enzyme family protein [Hyphomicrobiaceae bacterium]
MGEPQGGLCFLHDLVDRLAVFAADRAVIADSTGALTGGALHVAVTQAEHALRAAGLGAGDRIMLVAENSVALARLVFAASRIGAWIVLVNARLTEPEIRRIAAHAGPRALAFTSAASAAAAAHAARFAAAPLGSVAGVEIATLAEVAAEPDESDPARRVAALIYTSGTTGEPKGVMLSHASLLFVARSSGALRRLSPGDRVYGIMPVTHVFGLASVFLGSLAHGARLDLVARFDAADAARAFAEDGISIFQGVPMMYARFLELAERQGAPLAAPRLRYISAGGAPLDLGLKRRVEAMWGMALHNGYGMTEMAPTVSMTRMEAPAADDSVGPALPAVGIEIRSTETGNTLPPGEVGEICLRGPGAMLGYYRAPEETARAMSSDGWYRSGDLGRLDDVGNLYVVGRLKELIIRSGFNVYPPEVEGVLMLHPDVALAAVVGRKVVDRNGANEEVIAFIEAKAGRMPDIASVASFAAERLAPYKRPARYVVQPALPVTSAGKIRKSKLHHAAQSLGDLGDADTVGR